MKEGNSERFSKITNNVTVEKLDTRQKLISVYLTFKPSHVNFKYKGHKEGPRNYRFLEMLKFSFNSAFDDINMKTIINKITTTFAQFLVKDTWGTNNLTHDGLNQKSS